MKRMMLALIAAGFSVAGSAAMTGPGIATTQYFPLVDGARYDYMYTTGPWATSTVVLRSGQTWAGVPGLTAMHTTFVCNPNVACAPDATDFYRMDPDGLRYFGGTGANPGGTLYSMTTHFSPEWMLKNPVSPGTMMSGGLYQNMENWQTGVMGNSSMMGNQSYMSSYQALALETVNTPAGNFANVLHVREQRGNGYLRDVWYAPGVGMVMMSDANSSAVLTGYTIPGNMPQPGGGVAPLAFTPVTGLWWNPAESGTGYNIQVQRGTLVITMFSYSSTGEPIWYLAVGGLSNSGDGVMASGNLGKYRSGQCASCSYQAPLEAGSDGGIVITFTTPTRATVQLPNGRVTQIQPEVW